MKFRITEEMIDGEKKFFVEQKTGWFGWETVTDYFPVPTTDPSRPKFESRPIMFLDAKTAENYIKKRFSTTEGKKVIKEFNVD